MHSCLAPMLDVDTRDTPIMFGNASDQRLTHSGPAFSCIVVRFGSPTSMDRGEAMTEHHVVVVGAGFGGLEFAKAVVKAPVRVTLSISATIIFSSRFSTRSRRPRWRPPRSRGRSAIWSGRTSR